MAFQLDPFTRVVNVCWCALGDHGFYVNDQDPLNTNGLWLIDYANGNAESYSQTPLPAYGGKYPASFLIGLKDIYWVGLGDVITSNSVRLMRSGSYVNAASLSDVIAVGHTGETNGEKAVCRDGFFGLAAYKFNAVTSAWEQLALFTSQAYFLPINSSTHADGKNFVFEKYQYSDGTGKLYIVDCVVTATSAVFSEQMKQTSVISNNEIDLLAPGYTDGVGTPTDPVPTMLSQVYSCPGTPEKPVNLPFSWDSTTTTYPFPDFGPNWNTGLCDDPNQADNGELTVEWNWTQFSNFSFPPPTPDHYVPVREFYAYSTRVEVTAFALWESITTTIDDSRTEDRIGIALTDGRVPGNYYYYFQNDNFYQEGICKAGYLINGIEYLIEYQNGTHSFGTTKEFINNNLLINNLGEVRTGYYLKGYLDVRRDEGIAVHALSDPRTQTGVCRVIDLSDNQEVASFVYSHALADTPPVLGINNWNVYNNQDQNTTSITRRAVRFMRTAGNRKFCTVRNVDTGETEITVVTDGDLKTLLNKEDVSTTNIVDVRTF